MSPVLKPVAHSRSYSAQNPESPGAPWKFTIIVYLDCSEVHLNMTGHIPNLSWTIREADHVQVPVSPKVCKTEVTVVDCGEHVQQLGT